MTVLGKNTTGTTTNTSSGNKTVVSPATASGSGTLTVGHFRVAISAGTADLNLVIYADSSGAPGALLATSDTLTISNTTLAWNDFTFSGANQISISNATTYHVGASWADPGATSFTYERDNTASQRFEQTSQNPNPFGTPSLTSGGPVAVYLEFSAGASATPGAATGTGSAGAATTDAAYVAPGSVFDLTNWYLTLPTDDGSGSADTVTQPTLDTYADANFYLDASGRMVQVAPVNGFTTGGSSATRTERREQDGGVNSSWDIATAQRVLTESGFYDPTNITGGTNPLNVMIIGQVHATGGTPPIYITVDYDASPSRMRVFQDASGGVGNLATGFTTSDQLAYRIEVTGGQLNIYGVVGTEADLPSTPQFSYVPGDFTESTGCYFKAGAYNKTDTGTGASGSAIATTVYSQLLQNTVAANAGAAAGTGSALAPTADSSNRSASAGVASGTGSALAGVAGTETHIGTSILGNVTTGVRLVLEVAWGADLTDLTGAGWTWTDITADLQLSQGFGLDLQMGRPDESAQTQTAVLTAVLDNSEGGYSLGPQSPNYPNVVRNVPVRLRVSTDSGANWTVKFQGNAVGFTPSWDTSGQWATVTLTASGPLRRLNQGSLPVVSAYTYWTLANRDSHLIGHWPLEDGNYAATAASSIGGTPATIIGDGGPETIGNSNGGGEIFACTGLMAAGGNFNCVMPSYTNSGTQQIMWLFAETAELVTSGTSYPYICFIYPTSGSVAVWSTIITPGGFWALRAHSSTNPDGTPSGTLLFDSGSLGFNLLRNPSLMSLTLTTNGSNVDVRMETTNAAGTTIGATGTATGISSGAIASVAVLAPASIPNETQASSVGQITLRNSNTALSTYSTALAAYTGESVTDRVTRLAAGADIPLTILTDTATETSTNPADTMGPQYVDTLSNLLRECEATGLGVLFDGLNNGLTLVTRLLRASQQPKMTVDATGGAIVMPFAPIFDDQAIVNQATVTRRNGSSYTHTDTTSVDRADGIGIYSVAAAINQQDDTGLPATAKWLVHVGTPAGYRYPAWTFELAKDPSLIADWLTCIPTCRVDVTNIDSTRSQHPSGTIRNVLEGWHERISQHRWIVEANTSSYEPWRVITLAAASGSTSDTVGRYEPDSDTASTVATSASAGATSLSVAFTGTRWVTTADTGGSDNFPLTVEINGWPVTVSNITGTTSPQTFTVSALTHPVNAGDPITIYQNAVLGM